MSDSPADTSLQSSRYLFRATSIRSPIEPARRVVGCVRHDERVDAALGRGEERDAVVLQPSSRPNCGYPLRNADHRGALAGRHESGSAIRLTKTVNHVSLRGSEANATVSTGLLVDRDAGGIGSIRRDREPRAHGADDQSRGEDNQRPDSPVGNSHEIGRVTEPGCRFKSG